MSDLNQKLAAAIEKWPEVRPKDGANELRNDDSNTVCEWYWYSNATHNCRDVHSAEAHALIALSMLNALPTGKVVGRMPFFPGKWSVLSFCEEDDNPDGPAADSPTEALILFWLSREPGEGEGETSE